MTHYYNDDNSYHHDQQRSIIRCPSCRALITVEELHEYVNARPESKKEAIEEEIEMWGLTSYYDI